MELINLSSGAAYFKTPEIISEAAKKAIDVGQTSYGPTEGLPILRQAVSQKFLHKNKVAISPDQVLVTAGVKQALFNLFSTLLQPGDEVIVPVANWSGFHELLQQVKAKLVMVPTTSEDNFSIYPEKLEEVITPKTKLFIFCNPGNPTGRIYNKTDITPLLEALNKHPGILILSDEIYDEVTYGDQVPSLLEFEDTYDRFIVVNGFSKSFAMSGWRVGYLIVPQRFYKACYKFQENTISGVSPFSQTAAATALKNMEQVINPMNIILRSNREYVCTKLRETPGVLFNEPQGTYYFFPDLSSYLGKKTTSDMAINTTIDLADYLNEEFKVKVWAGEYFGAPGFARISFAVERHLLQEAFTRIQMALFALN